MIHFYKKNCMADSTPPEKPSKGFDLKQAATFVAAITALVTALTSLVKAVDKRLEQASYETLSASIENIQKDEAALREQIIALNAKLATHDVGHAEPDDVEPPPPMPSASASGPVAVADAGKPHHKVAGSHPSAHPPVSASVAASAHPPATTSVASAPPLPLPPPRPPLPKWGDVKAKADQM